MMENTISRNAVSLVAGLALLGTTALAPCVVPSQALAGDEQQTKEEKVELKYKAGEQFKDGDYVCTVNADGTSVTIGAAVFFDSSANSYYYDDDEYYYDEDEDDYYYYYGVRLPQEIAGYKVTAIADGGFYGQSEICKVAIPEGVESIGDEAFSGCSGLTDIIMPKSLKTVGARAFVGTSAQSVSFPEDVAIIGKSVLSDNKKLTSVCVGNALETIPESAFANCPKLKELTIGSNKYHEQCALKKVAKNAFSKTKIADVYYFYASFAQDEQVRYEAIKIASGNDLLKKAAVHYVDYKTHRYAYTKYAAGTTLTAGNLTYKVGTSSVATVTVTKCKSAAKKVQIPETVTIDGVSYQVTAIGGKAFKGCAKLSKLTVGAGITKIGTSAFEKCGKLKAVTFEGGTLKAVGKKAFAGTHKKLMVKAPAASVKSYKKMLKKAGASKKAKYKKIAA